MDDVQDKRLYAEQKLNPLPLGALIASGKTKEIYEIQNDPDNVIVLSGDAITAGDGARRDIIPGKGVLSNVTTCNVFRLLRSCGLEVAYKEQDSPNSFVAPKCVMFPYEVVVRRVAGGSYVKRHPHVPKGHRFSKLVVEFHLKTKDKLWNGRPLVADDPLLLHEPLHGQIALYDPAIPFEKKKPFLLLTEADVFSTTGEWDAFPKMAEMARVAFLVLERAWQIAGCALWDIKVEFGFDVHGQLLLADVIDNDSWRVLKDGVHLDKQVYRDGAPLTVVKEKYAQVAEMTTRFRNPRQQIILWCGSKKDDTRVFQEAQEAVGNCGVDLVRAICSAHKEPILAVDMLNLYLENVPDSVVIAHVGMSNAAGPLLGAASTVPVISVPATIAEFPNDIWSSLRLPSHVPAMTVLDPANAIRAALRIFAARSPRVYAHIAPEVEGRAVNTLTI